MKKSNKKQNIVFIVSAMISIGIALWGILAKESFGTIANAMMESLKGNFSWLYLGVMLFFVLFCAALALGPLGKVRLGEDQEKPEYSTVSWFAMLLGAGMGIGLVFWSVAEPISHYIVPMKGIEPESEEAIRFAMRSCFMHWGVHPWACYGVMGLGLAYFQFRRKESATVSNLLRPMIGYGKIGNTIGTIVDIFTIVLTTMGVGTSFGMGCLQISEGLNYLFGIPNNVYVWLTIIILIGIIYLRSAISGVGKGIKLLSNINLCFFVGLMLSAFLVSTKSDAMHLGSQAIWDAIVNFFPDSLRLSSQGDSTWIQNWRVFYWAWWLSWAPFVGVFIARISRGRTIREFVLGVMVIPSAVSYLWFTVFGNLSFHVVDHFTNQQLKDMASSPQTALFRVFGEYPGGFILSLIAIALLITFFVTSANSATFVLAMLTSRGVLDPPARKKIFWGIMIAVLAFVLILSGGISMIQTISIVIAFPYLFILLMICASLVLSLIKDEKMRKGN